MNKIGSLSDGEIVKLFGRRLRMRSGAVEIYTKNDYLKEIFKAFGLDNAKAVVAPGVVTM